ncbi:MAG: hypothetical protein Q9182_007194 [Xanthomendoza sp. 2 TL-2023]
MHFMPSATQYQALVVALLAWSATAIPTGTDDTKLTAGFERRDALLRRKWTMNCGRSKDDVNLIKEELNNAKRISKYGHDHFDDDSKNSKLYLEKFISQGLRDIPDKYIINQLRGEYQHGSDMLGDSDNYEMTITCDDNSDFCKKGYYAHMSNSKATMNICSAWFDPKGTPAERLSAPYLEKTDDILKDCHDLDKTKFKTIENFWAGKGVAAPKPPRRATCIYLPNTTVAQALLHENSLNLAAGSYKVGKSRELKPDGTPLCPDPNDRTKPGYCDANFSIDNADTLAIMAADQKNPLGPPNKNRSSTFLKKHTQTMSSTFQYRSVMDAQLNEEEARHNSRDPSGKAAQVIMPAKRERARLTLPKFYHPSQHAKSPHLSVHIQAPVITTMSLAKPFPIISTITHHANPTGNPDAKPITFDLNDTCLTAFHDNDLYPWLLLRRTAEDGEMEELDDDHDTSCPPFEDETGLHHQVPICRENGFVTLAVGESVRVEAEWVYSGTGVKLEEGGEYCINFRGCWLRWWKAGDLEELKDEKKASRAELGSLDMPIVVLAASNLVDFTVGK